MKKLEQLHRPGTGTYVKGQERILQILEASRDILITNGYAGLSMRKIATAVGITVGNLHYYYPTKKDLIANLLDHVIVGYLQDFENVRTEAGTAPEDQFVAVIRLIIEDLNTPETTNFFPELWAMANHDETAAERMNELYHKARLDINELVGLINPGLSDDEREQVSLFISASMEGLTPFIGSGKPWRSKTPGITNIAAYSFLHLVKTIDSETIGELPLAAQAQA
ncbi:TetR/AcrR family transcriptional regulator [Pseudomaricurvus alkylphenolicus]|jgi:AcrR family transcriptional regulator|uniref:TetR/AcrR family transcriptional regulator n=1 Tax=Pseudomaricurvus alkylphenolicus TaxID=1306991 RepID=UPI00141D9519|nr:TetR/AcrR family transcriptional regulator [Pseudomaricurvus alkylphenolicus]NIB40181.1 TetR/AcrR family transcriptional regulator [Pseudomaricurvus alkylphenolicus]